MMALRSFFSKRPLITNAISLSALYAGADLTQQTLKGVDEHYDLAAPGRLVILATGFYAPTFYYWFKWLDRVLPGTAPKTVFKKVITDQAIMGAIGTFVFFAGNAALEGKKSKQILEEVKTKWPKAYSTGWLYWPAAQAINFFLLPTALRTVYVGAAAFVWTNVLVYIKSSKNNEISNEELSTSNQ